MVIETRPRKTALVVGACGQVGYQLLHELYFFKQYNVIGMFNKEQLVNLPIDLKLHHFSSSEYKNDADIVFIPAYKTNVETFDHNEKINSVLAQIISKHDKKAKIVFFSTDYVFAHGSDLSETDFPDPLNEYGRHKLNMEHYILANCFNPLIIRTSGVFGPELNRKNFVYQLVYNNYSERHVPVDQYGSPTYCPDLVDKTLKLVERDACGIYHIVGKSFLNRYKFAMKICDKFDLDRDKIYGVTTDVLKQEAERPKYIQLSTKKLENELGEQTLDVDTALEKFKEQYEGSYPCWRFGK